MWRILINGIGARPRRVSRELLRISGGYLNGPACAAGDASLNDLVDLIMRADSC